MELGAVLSPVPKVANYLGSKQRGVARLTGSTIFHLLARDQNREENAHGAGRGARSRCGRRFAFQTAEWTSEQQQLTREARDDRNACWSARCE